MTLTELQYDNWLVEVDDALLDVCDLSLDDLPDVPSRDWFDDGVSPKSAAKRALRFADGTATYPIQTLHDTGHMANALALAARDASTVYRVSRDDIIVRPVERDDWTASTWYPRLRCASRMDILEHQDTLALTYVVTQTTREVRYCFN